MRIARKPYTAQEKVAGHVESDPLAHGSAVVCSLSDGMTGRRINVPSIFSQLPVPSVGGATCRASGDRLLPTFASLQPLGRIGIPGSDSSIRGCRVNGIRSEAAETAGRAP